VGKEEEKYLELLNVALSLVIEILGDAKNRTIELEALVDQAIGLSTAKHGQAIERQTFGDAILHGSSTGKIKVDLSSAGVAVEALSKPA
jgi:hypothetical protein